MDRELFCILQAYGELIPTSTIPWPSSIPAHAVQLFLIDHVLLSGHLRTYPPSAAYQRAFWKWVIQTLENFEEEVDERIYEHYLSLLPKSSTGLAIVPPPPAPSYITRLWRPYPEGDQERNSTIEISRYKSTTLFESRTSIESGTTGLRTWGASLILAEYIILHPEIIQKKVLELGSGIGFLGMIIAELQLLSDPLNQRIEINGIRPPIDQNAVWMTDVDEKVLSRCIDNILLPCNGSSAHPRLNVRPLDWSAAVNKEHMPTLISLLHEIDADVIIGADIVFDPETIPWLIEVLQLALGLPLSSVTNEQREAYIALRVRNETTFDQFVKIAGAVLNVREKALDLRGRRVFLDGLEGQLDENMVQQRIKLFHITSKSK